MLKSERTYRTGKVFLVFGILFAIVTVIAAVVHCMEYSWMPFELTFELPFQVLLEYVLIGAGLTLIFLGLAWICYGVASNRAKKESDALLHAEEVHFEEHFACEPVVVESKPCQNQSKNIAATWKSKLSRVADTDAARMVGKFVLPAVIAGAVAVTAVLVFTKKDKKAKRRQQFYRWLG